jgi:tetratricopeptide (TPR) repeat protein
MKNFRKLFIAAAILCILAACRSNRDRLMEINSFLNDNRLDTAQFCLTQVTPSDLSVYDEALYNLVTVKLNHLRYHPVPSDTIIRSCVDVFTNFNDKERLAESLYYQAVTYYEEGHVPQAFTAMKKAEAIAQDIDDLTIRHKIIESLTDWNMSEHQYQLAMSYGRRNLALSTMANDSNWIAYALVFISQVYTGMNQRDSAKHYLDKCVTYMKDVPDSQRVDFYNYIAAVTMKTDLPAAHAYAMKGNDIRPNSVGYVTLAQIRQREGADNVAIDSLCYKACNLASNPGERIFVLQQVMRLYAKQERYEQAYRASKAFVEVWDKEARLREEHDVRNVQAAYDYKMKEMRIRQNTNYTTLAAILLLIFFALILLYQRYRKNQNTREAVQNRFLAKTYRKKIKEIEEEKKDIETRLESLTEFNERQVEILSDGRKLYEHFMSGGSTVLWNNADCAHFIEYYKLIDLPFVNYLKNDYKNLSPRYMLYAVLYEMGKNDSEVAKIMGLGEDSIRMMKSRLRRKDNK